MSGTLNKVMLIGYLGEDVKIHYFEKDKCIGRFSLATHQSYTNEKTAEKITNTQWHSIVVKDKLAEVCERYLRKGDRIYCEGRIKTSQWEGQGTRHTKVEIYVHQIQFLSTKIAIKKEDII